MTQPIALDAFVDCLRGVDPALADLVQPPERRSTAVLFGPTQVGKTTLLLALLGIADDHQAQVNTVLRAGRTAGKSATAVPTEYHLVETEQWQLQHGISPTITTDTAEHTTEILSGVRAGIADGTQPADLLRVGVPGRLAAEEHTLSVVDLPGVWATNKVERTFAENAANVYVPAADLVILACRVDDLGKLDPRELPGAKLPMWPQAPERFRVVLTHAFKAESERTRLRHGPPDPERYLEQIESHFPLGGRRDDLAAILLPVDLGRSRSSIPEADADTVNTINATALAALRHAIASASGPEARHTAARAIPQISDAARVMRSRQIHTQLDTLDRVVAKRQHRLAAARRAEAAHNEKLTRLDGGLHELQAAPQRLEAALSDHLAGAPGIRGKRKRVRARLRTARRYLTRGTRRIWSQWLDESGLPRDADKAIAAPLSKAAKGLDTTIRRERKKERHKIRRWRQKHKYGRRQIADEGRQALEAGSEEILSSLTELADGVVKGRHRKLERQIRRIQVDSIDARQRATDLEADLAGLNSGRESRTRQLDELDHIHHLVLECHRRWSA